MKLNLTICGIHELPEHESTPWTHVVSIWDKSFYDDLDCREKVKAVAPNAEILFSFFDDVDDPTLPDAPTLRQIKRILDFTEQIPAKARVLVHCRAGVSRSTATAYAILCQHSPPGSEIENLLHVETLRDLVMPNRLIIRLADNLLKREGKMLLHLEHGS
jgi:predicted protein tyrosine phosphatase